MAIKVTVNVQKFREGSNRAKAYTVNTLGLALAGMLVTCGVFTWLVITMQPEEVYGMHKALILVFSVCFAILSMVVGRCLGVIEMIISFQEEVDEVIARELSQ